MESRIRAHDDSFRGGGRHGFGDISTVLVLYLRHIPYQITSNAIERAMSAFKQSGLFSRSSQSSAEQRPDFLSYLAIKNVLSLYCVALDTKDFLLLHEVFTQDVEAIYPFATMFGVEEIMYRISRRQDKTIPPIVHSETDDGSADSHQRRVSMH